MTAKLHLAPGMRRGRSQTSEHQTALGSVNLIALDVGFIGSRGPKERRGAKAEPDFLSRISFASVSQRSQESAQEERCVVPLLQISEIKNAPESVQN